MWFSISMKLQKQLLLLVRMTNTSLSLLLVISCLHSHFIVIKLYLTATVPSWGMTDNWLHEHLSHQSSVIYRKNTAIVETLSTQCPLWSRSKMILKTYVSLDGYMDICGYFVTAIFLLEIQKQSLQSHPQKSIIMYKNKWRKCTVLHLTPG